MYSVKPIVIQTENLPQECSDWLSERCDLHMCPADSLRFRELLPEASGLAIRTYTTVDLEMITLASNLKVVGRAGVGLDNVDLQACNNKNIRVVYTPEANSVAVVEFVLTNLFMLLRPLFPIETVVDKEVWLLQRETALCSRQFDEMTLGIVGFGRVGSRLGRLAREIGFRVMYCDIIDIEESHGCKRVSLDTLLHESDAISIHVDGRPENKHLCNADFFASMKPSSPFVNTSRGHVVDAKALANHLRHNIECSAVLDVHESEPFQIGYPLLGLSNARLFPHIAAKTKSANLNMGWVVRDIDAVLCGNPPSFEAETSLSQ